MEKSDVTKMTLHGGSHDGLSYSAMWEYGQLSKAFTFVNKNANYVLDYVDFAAKVAHYVFKPL